MGNSPSIGAKLGWDVFDIIAPLAPFTETSFNVAALDESSIYRSIPVSSFAEISVNIIYGLLVSGDALTGAGGGGGGALAGAGGALAGAGGALTGAGGGGALAGGGALTGAGGGGALTGGIGGRVGGCAIPDIILY